MTNKHYHRCGEINKFYPISRENWRAFLQVLRGIGHHDEPWELTAKQRELWDCYFLAKEHGRNEKGLFSLPWERWQRVMDAVK